MTTETVQPFTVPSDVDFDTVTRMLAEQVAEGINSINEANVSLLEDETGTGDRAIDKKFKDNEVEDEEAKKIWAKAEKARETYRKLLTDARNAYRKSIGEDEKSESEVDKDKVKEVRTVVMNSLTLIQTLAKSQNNSSVQKWAESVSVPQVGRQGTSSVGGTGSKKPRVYVHIGDTVHNSFGEAAKALSTSLSTDTNKVTVTSPDLVSAWEEQGAGDTFEYAGQTLKVVKKNQDS